MSNIPDKPFKDLPDDSEVASQAGAIFRSACENTDSYHALRLGLARRKALNAGAGHRLAGFRTALAGVAVACCALVIGIVWVRPALHAPSTSGIASPVPVAAGPAESDDELSEVGSSQMEMVEDLDFYRWVATQPAVASAPSRSSR
jgi:hypothetical protein